MGYFSRLDGAMRHQDELPTLVSQEPTPQPIPVRPVAVAPVSAVPAAPQPSVAAAPAAAQAQMEVETPSAVNAADLAADAAETPAAPAIQLDTPTPADDAAARRAHEEAEAARKAKWESSQRERKAAEQARLNRLAAMSDEDVVEASTQRVSADTEKLTRRSMKDCVSEHVQAMCRQDPAFARRTMHPRKSMMHCFWYINRKAKEFIEKEMKANGAQAESGVYGEDVPDDLVYQWAVDYFNDPDAQEDKEKEEKFTPRPYVGKSSKASKPAKPKAKKETPPPKAAPKVRAGVDGQMSLLEAAG